MKKNLEQIHIGIIGAGICGLSCALALAKLGCRITLIEKHTEASEIGAGIQLSPNATAILRHWDLLEQIEAQSVKPLGIEFLHWKHRHNIARFPINEESAQTPYLHIHRADLHHALLAQTKSLANIELIGGEQLVDIHTSTQGCIAICEDTYCRPKEHRFDYVIGADGIHSRCKDFLNDNAEPQFTGNIAWRGLIPSHKLPFKVEKKAHLVMAPDSHLVFYFVRGGEFLNYVAVSEGKALSQESWTQQGEMDELLDDFSMWHSDFRQLLAQSDEEHLYKWALYDRNPLKSWSRDNMIVAGDAAHPVLPFLSQGAAMAIEDAFVLAQCFQTCEGAEIGKQFFSLRSPRCNKVLDASRKNRKLYHESNLIKRMIRDTGSRFFSQYYPQYVNRRLDWLYTPISD